MGQEAKEISSKFEKNGLFIDAPTTHAHGIVPQQLLRSILLRPPLLSAQGF
jgi:hypothetical protein